MLAAAHSYVTRTYCMELTSKAISRLTAPNSVLTAWGFFAAAVVLTLLGEAPRALLRFVAVWAATVSLSAGIRILGSAVSRGEDWSGLLTTASLPYFDDEMKGRASFGAGAVERTLAGMLFAGCGLALTVLLTVGQPAEQGVIVLGSNTVESWQDPSRGLLARELPVRLEAAAVDVVDGELELVADRLSDDWQAGALLVPGQAVGFADLELEWIGVTPNEAVDGVSGRVVVDGVEVETTFTVGRQIEVGDARVVMTEFHENRYGALGPAGRFAVRRGDETDVLWAFLWGEALTASHSESGVSVELTRLEPSLSAIVRVRSASSPLMVPALAVFLGLMALFGARLVRFPVSIRGRSGDYELVGISRGSVESAASQLLGQERLAEWKQLLEQLRRTTRDA